MEVNQTTYENLKRQVSGFYFKFNTNVLKYHMNKIWDYEYLLETSKHFTTFTEFYRFHTEGKWEVMNQRIDMMLHEARNKGLNPTRDLVKSCLIVRLGNVYNGMFTENKILNTFSTLSPYITCKKTEKEVDMLYKVDGIVEVVGIDKLAIQIKPISFLSYDKGSELPFHQRFEMEFGPAVYYVLYKNKNLIQFNNVEIRLDEKEKIIEQIEQLLVYN
jgi:hypothetical protein